jgi:predicted DNA-binding transcriptional regulator YafY
MTRLGRDKDDLRAIGVPVRSEHLPGQNTQEPAQGYRLARRDFYLPYIRLLGESNGGSTRDGTGQKSALGGLGAPFELAEHEASAALDGLLQLADLPDSPIAGDALSVYRKLTFDLDPERFRFTPIAFPTPGRASVRHALRLLSDARTRRKRVSFRYRGIRRNTETRRDVAPYGLLYRGGNWYLIGHDAWREAIRTFRVSRMDGLKPNGASPKTPDFEIPSDFDLKAFVGRQPWELGGADDRPIKVRVLFHPPASLWIERNAFGAPVEQRPGGATVREFQVRDPAAFLRWILSLDGGAEILLPAELRRDLRRTIGRVADLHGEATHA